MSTMQIVFSIIGLVLIAAIIGHGVWTIRRNEKTQQQRAQIIEQKRRQADSEGFDDDGVGAVRVVKRSESQPASQPAQVKAKQSPAAEPSKTPVPEPRLESLNDDVPKQIDESNATQPLGAIRAQADEAELDLPEVKVDQDQVRERAQAHAAEPRQTKAADKPAQPTQQSMDLPLERSADEPIINEEPEEVIVLHVTGDIQGAILLQQMTELGFKFGDFDIFHRHVDTAGNGAVLFSLANMYNPGSFNIDTIETFQTDGVALFLALPIKSNSLQAFTMMHNAAVKLAAAVARGQVLDEHRNPLTRQAVQHIHQRIREFERKRLIKH